MAGSLISIPLILNLMKSTYLDLFGKEPEVKVMHAGLECGGIIQGAYPDMDMVSIEPDLEYPHSPDELSEYSFRTEDLGVCYSYIGENLRISFPYT